jgi:hypothetical protein
MFTISIAGFGASDRLTALVTSGLLLSEDRLLLTIVFGGITLKVTGAEVV